MKRTIKTALFYILFALVVILLYLSLVLYLSNLNLFHSVIFAPFPTNTKFQLLWVVVSGWPYTMPVMNSVTTVVVACLTGINAALLLYRIRVLSSYGTLHVVVGGSSLLGIVSSGCASCGLPILALVGLGGSVSMLPLQGYELSIVSILLLCLSIYLLIKNIRTARQCVVKKKSVD